MQNANTELPTQFEGLKTVALEPYDDTDVISDAELAAMNAAAGAEISRVYGDPNSTAGDRFKVSDRVLGPSDVFIKNLLQHRTNVPHKKDTS